MTKIILLAIGLIVGVPAVLVALSAFQIFVFNPWQHLRNVERMDAKNDLVWEESVARVVTVEAELRTMDRTEKLTVDVVCYEGNFATAWSLKGSGQKTGIGPKSIGFEALQAELPTGGTLDIDMWRLCDEALLMDIEELPLKVEYSNAHIVGPELSLYCRFYPSRASGSILINTDAARVGYPYIVALEERPLQTLATRSEMGSSETPSVSNGFARRWEWATRTGKSHWNAEKACWTDNVGRCSETLTNYCGINRR